MYSTSNKCCEQGSKQYWMWFIYIFGKITAVIAKIFCSDVIFLYVHHTSQLFTNIVISLIKKYNHFQKNRKINKYWSKMIGCDSTTVRQLQVLKNWYKLCHKCGIDVLILFTIIFNIELVYVGLFPIIILFAML